MTRLFHMAQPGSTHNLQNRHTLRQQLRARRNALSPQQQQRAAQQLTQQLSRHLWFKQAQHIGFYLPSDGEIDPCPLLRLALALGKSCYLPVILAKNRLQFRRVTTHTPLIKNRFGIGEPPAGTQIRPNWLLDLVFMPLVGFDLHGNRLGMGGGYYDRSFSHSTSQPHPVGRRVGLAHSCQQVTSLIPAHWDVPLAAIATEQKIIVSMP